LLPYLEQHSTYDRLPPYFTSGGSIYFSGDARFGPVSGTNIPEGSAAAVAIRAYDCPSDNSGGAGGLSTSSQIIWGTSNYAANALVFGMLETTPFSDALTHTAKLSDVTDGTSNTIFYTEKFAICRKGSKYPPSEQVGGGSFWAHPPRFPNTGENYGAVLGFPRKSPTGAYIDLFQAQPDAGSCNPFLAQSPHRGGIHVALGDGSVRFVGARIARETWYAAFTPSGGEPSGIE
jgi:hypothetical protein